MLRAQLVSFPATRAHLLASIAITAQQRSSIWGSGGGGIRRAEKMRARLHHAESGRGVDRHCLHTRASGDSDSAL